MSFAQLRACVFGPIACWSGATDESTLQGFNMSAVMGMSENRTLRNGVPKEVDWRLEEWARWRGKVGQEMGWPAETLLARIVEYGPLGAGSAGKPPIEMPAPVAEIDKILAKMPETLRLVIICYYTTWQPFPLKARDCRMSTSKYRNRLEAAQWFVYARLTN